MDHSVSCVSPRGLPIPSHAFRLRKMGYEERPSVRSTKKKVAGVTKVSTFEFVCSPSFNIFVAIRVDGYSFPQKEVTD